MSEWKNTQAEGTSPANAAEEKAIVCDAQPSVSENVKAKAKDAAEAIKEKAAPVLENVRAKLSEAKEKADPACRKIKEGLSDAVDSVKEGADRLLGGDAPDVHVRNPLFDSLEDEAKAQRLRAKDAAEEMQRKLEEMMRGLK